MGPIGSWALFNKEIKRREFMIAMEDIIACVIYTILFMLVAYNKHMSDTGRYFWIGALMFTLGFFVWRI